MERDDFPRLVKTLHNGVTELDIFVFDGALIGRRFKADKISPRMSDGRLIRCNTESRKVRYFDWDKEENCEIQLDEIQDWRD